MSDPTTTRTRFRNRAEDAKLTAIRLLRRIGLEPSRLAYGGGFDEPDRTVIRTVERYTMTSPERIAAVCEATRYVEEHGIEGAIVECGVWRGGSMMAMALTLLELGTTERQLYLYDTFAGMPEPQAIDTTRRGRTASSMIWGLTAEGRGSALYRASLEDVRANLGSTAYPADRVTFVPGPVEETVPATTPEKIALLRLDTDWYESTRHELEHLLPRLEPGGVLIIDDYGHWAGARRAVDEYLEETGLPLLLNRIDYTGRIAVMPGLEPDHSRQ